MSGWFEVLAWPPSLVNGGLLVLVSVLYGTQAKRKIRPYLLATQIGLIMIIAGTLITAFNSGDLFPSQLVKAFLGQTFGAFFGFAIIGWLIIQICFIIRFRNDQANIFTRNRRS